MERGHSHTEEPAADQLSDMVVSPQDAPLNAEQERDKRDAISPASSPTKLPSAKKQNGASLAAQHTEHEECHTNPPAAGVSATEMTVKEHLLFNYKA